MTDDKLKDHLDRVKIFKQKCEKEIKTYEELIFNVLQNLDQSIMNNIEEHGKARLELPQEKSCHCSGKSLVSSGHERGCDYYEEENL